MDSSANQMKRLCLTMLCAALVVSCGGGDSSNARITDGAVSSSSGFVCDGSCANASSFLSTSDVEAIVARAVAEAQARGVKATIAVVDRVGNVLAVFRMTGALENVTMRTSDTAVPTLSGGFENIEVIPATLAAISKALTGAYLSSEGNAFSTRTASQIIQSHFNPGELSTPSGPLFGVQFSQLPCSDVVTRFTPVEADVGPKRSPLGLAGDPGGFPLYRSGTPVGGVGVVVDPIYGIDRNVIDVDVDIDEAVALAAAGPMAAPEDRRADRITADGKTLRFSDTRAEDLRSRIDSPPAFTTLLGSVGQLVAVPGYAEAVIRAGIAFGQARSGVRADSQDYLGLDAFVLVDATGVERYRPRPGTDGAAALTALEVQSILSSALRVANRSRAQIRRPLDTPARVSITVVDSQGEILGLVRSRDAPVFGIDVAVQKARGAAFYRRVAQPIVSTPCRRRFISTEFSYGCARSRRRSMCRPRVCSSACRMPCQTARQHSRRAPSAILRVRTIRMVSMAIRSDLYLEAPASGVRSTPACRWTWCTTPSFNTLRSFVV